MVLIGSAGDVAFCLVFKEVPRSLITNVKVLIFGGVETKALP